MREAMIVGAIETKGKPGAKVLPFPAAAAETWKETFERLKAMGDEARSRGGGFMTKAEILEAIREGRR